MKKHSILVWICLLGLVASCNYPVIRTWQHTPFHPNNNQNITFTVKGNDRYGVKTVRLSIFEYELFVNSNGYRAAQQRPGGTWGVVKTWNVASPTAGDYEFSHDVSGFPASSKITYRFEVTNTKNLTKTQEARFDAGTSPWPNSTIVLWSSTPRDPAHTIDICFVPDQDYNEDWSEVREELEKLVYDGYHVNNMIQWHKDKYAFYYTRAEGDAEESPRKLDVPSSVASAPHIDVFCIVHKNTFRDARSGNKFSTEAVNRGTAVHETAHGVFNLRDEYCCDGGYGEITPHSNLFDSQAECQAYNSSIGAPASDCRSYTDSGGNTWWAPEPSGLNCIMFNDGDAAMPDFARVCINRMVWYYTELVND